MKILNIVGARPNFMKIAPIVEAMNRHPDRLQQKLVHTGQHYDERMSKAFFDDLGMPKPDINLEVGSGSHAEQTGRVMMAFERDGRRWPAHLYPRDNPNPAKVAEALAGGRRKPPAEAEKVLGTILGPGKVHAARRLQSGAFGEEG